MPKALSESKKELLDKLLRGRDPALAKADGIPRRPPGVDPPLSYGQEQLWIHSQFAAGIPIYNDPITMYRYGPLDRSALEKTLTEIVRRHESWRTTFAWKGGQLAQFIQPPPPHIEIPFLDLSTTPEATRDEAARKQALADALLPFDLETGPTYRARLTRISENEHRLYLTLHHLIFDGLSLLRIFVSELEAIYEAFSRGLPSPLPELPLQYGDYAVWQRKWVDQIAPAQLAYWRAKLAGAAQLDTLKTDHPRPAIQTYRGATVRVTLSPEVSAGLQELDQKLDVTLFVSLLATFYLLMWARSGEEDVAIGTTSAGRHRLELEGLMGYFLDTLVLRVSLAGDPTFADLAAQCKETVFGALANDGVPFSMLVKELAKGRDASRNPFFQVMFSLEPPLAPLGPAWKFARMDVHNGSTKFDINLELDNTPHGIDGRLIYNQDLFKPSTIDRMIADWHAVVTEVVADPSRPISKIVAEMKRKAIIASAQKEISPAAETPKELNGLLGFLRRVVSKK